jgi:hypothetical protein
MIRAVLLEEACGRPLCILQTNVRGSEARYDGAHHSKADCVLLFFYLSDVNYITAQQPTSFKQNTVLHREMLKSTVK